MKYLKALGSLLLMFGLVYLLNNPLGAAPALGKFLSPFEGFWANSESIVPETGYSETKLNLAGLQGEVTVSYDENHVPHIFAENDHDLYFAQGYVQAKDRLWQMDMVARSAGGRLAEVVGDKATEYDRYHRRMGSVFGAEKSVAQMEANPASKVSVQAYTEGINTYIKQLSPRNYPVEFKLLGYAPEPWTTLKSALLLKEMSFTLAVRTDDFKMTNAMNLLGQGAMDELFPDYPTIESPIIPEGTKIDFTPLPIPKKPTGTYKAPEMAYHEDEPNPGIGSNNWAVSGSRTATGLPILSGDPHLKLSLPSIWYQVQLNAPGVNTYGVTLPGSPGVVIGFNENIAWSMTNVASDVVDWYQVKFKDAKRTEYWHDGKWKPVTRRLETIKVKGKPNVVDTVLYTHHGPVVYLENQKAFNSDIPKGYAVRWIAHEASDELATTYYLNRAKNYEDYVKALSFYACPAQNFIFASNQNDIAIWVNGKFPLKWKEQGKYLLDGSDPANDWQGWIPHTQNPHVKNPTRGFVSSANQFSVNPKDYPYYLHWTFAPANRGRRINERLATMTHVTADSMRLLQFDNFNIDARTFLPTMLKNVNQASLSPDQLAAFKVLATWNYQNTSDQIAPSIFEKWMPVLSDGVWRDEIADNDSIPTKLPSTYRTMEMLEKQPTAKWFDNVKTKNKVETAPDILTESFKATVDTLSKNLLPMGPAWNWGKVKRTVIEHLLPIKAFHRSNFETQGGARIVNATTEKTGPSWRMIVELGKKPKAYGIFPGGQSGNPASAFYDNMIEKWTKGELNELLFLSSKDEQSPRIKSALKLKKS